MQKVPVVFVFWLRIMYLTFFCPGVFLSALEADSQFSFALVEYGRFLATRGQPYSVYAPLFKATKVELFLLSSLFLP